MSTLKQKLASRANGKLSRGPVTPEGKRNSAANAIHHGISGEARERFEGTLDRRDAAFEPETNPDKLSWTTFRSIADTARSFDLLNVRVPQARTRRPEEKKCPLRSEPSYRLSPLDS